MRNAPYEHLTATKAIAAARLVRTGEVFSLDLPMDGPPLVDHPLARPPLQHRARMHNQVRPRPEHGYVVVNDDIVEFAMQGSSHWDALAHWGAIEPDDDAVFFGGAALDETFPNFGARTLGIGLLGGAVVTRGVLLDLVLHLGGPDVPYLAADVIIDRAVIEACLDDQRLELEPGDAVLLRTGFHVYMDEFRHAPPGERLPASPGLAIDTLDLFRDAGTFALISDNPSVEPAPMPTGRFHTLALKHLGIHLGELWRLDDLAAACRVDDVREFLLVASPLAVPRAFGSPANAVAVR